MRFFRRHKIVTLILLMASFIIYQNYTIIIEENPRIDKENIQYVNDLYMSDGRIYNNYLNKQEKKMYRLIFEHTKNYQKKININLADFQCADYNECFSLINKVHDAIIADHPELLNYATYVGVYENGKITLNLKFAFNLRLQETISVLRIEGLIAEIKYRAKDMTDLEKIKYVYDWMGQNNTYDSLFTYASKNQSIYNVFMRKNAVCAGFAKASQVIFQNIGITSYGVTGVSTDNHMWNIIKYKDKYYYYDSTVAVSIKNKNDPHYYDGLKQTEISYYTMDYPEWYPKITQENVFMK